MPNVDVANVEPGFVEVHCLEVQIVVVARLVAPADGIAGASVIGGQGGGRVPLKAAQLLIQIKGGKGEVDIRPIQILVDVIGPAQFEGDVFARGGNHLPQPLCQGG